jgi:hypothetical protein
VVSTDVHVTIGADNQQAFATEMPGQVEQQAKARRVGPLQVVEQQHNWLDFGQPIEKLPRALEHP